MNYDNFEEVFSFEHLLKSADICRKNVWWKASVQNFMFEKEYNVSVIQNELMQGTFKIKHRHKFVLFERGKKRNIQSVHIRERVVQRCLCDYCLTPLLQKTFCYDNCASQKDKGINFAINRVIAHLDKYYREYGNEGYVLLFDYSNYFGSIDHDMIMEKLKKYITDPRILNLIWLFLNEFDEGLGLGSQVSQVLSLFAASPVDHMIKDSEHFKHYVRYMDDGIVFSHSRKDLELLLEHIENLSESLGLKLSKRKTRIVSIKRFKFLKKRFTLLDNEKIVIRLSPESFTRMRRKLKKFKGLYLNGKMTSENIETSYTSWRGFAEKYDSYHSIKNLNETYDNLMDYITGSDTNEQICQSN